MINRFCIKCGKKFASFTTDTSYCSEECAKTDNKYLQGTYENKCSECGIIFSKNDKKMIISQGNGHIKSNHIACHYKRLQEDLRYKTEELNDDLIDVKKDKKRIKEIEEELDYLKKTYKLEIMADKL